MKVAIINIRSVKIHTIEPLRPDTDGDVGDRTDDATITNTGDTTITDPVSIRILEIPTPDSLNDEALRAVVAHLMAKMF